jgi:hypothetical protein
MPAEPARLARFLLLPLAPFAGNFTHSSAARSRLRRED